MNWLAKINLSTVVLRFGAFRSAMLLIIIIALALFCGYRMGNYYHGYQSLTLIQQQTRLEAMYQKNVVQTRRINTLEVELEVERMANQKSQSTLKLIEQQHYKVKKELAFYEKVMAPEKQADGLVIDGVTVTKTESPNHFRFQVVLVQQLLRKRYVKGHVTLSLHGSLNDKPTTLPLEKVSILSKKDLSFSFQYFKNINGNMMLPEGFVPESISVSAILPKSKWQKYDRVDQSYSWSQALDNIEQNLP